MAGQATDLRTVNQLIAQGKGFMSLHNGLLSGATSTATAGSGHFSGEICANTIGTTLPATLAGFPMPPYTSPARLTHMQMTGANNGAPGAGYLAMLYKLGTQVLTATGDQFTHDAATFPVLRTMYGQASQPVDLIPLIQITTATSVTAPVLKMVNVAATTGYKNQAGNNVNGTKTWTAPLAATATNTTQSLMLEDGDSGITDLTSLQTTMASTTGAATIWGMEILAPAGHPSINSSLAYDSLTAGLNLQDLTPAVATSGTATAVLAYVLFVAATKGYKAIAMGVADL
jgi:hypothetical protein